MRTAAFATPILVALASSPMILRSEPPSVFRLSEYQKCEWQIEDGLPENNVRMISQRPDGALLLATATGIASFDGQRFRTLSIGDPGKTPLMSDNEAVNAILPVSNDDLWIGTDGSGVIHQTRSGSVNISEQAGRFNERIRAFYKDNAGVVWIATQNGVERYVNGHLEVITGTGMISGDITTPFAEDGHGGMFYVTSAGLFHWRNGIAQPYRMQLPALDTPVAVYRDPKRRIWIGTLKHIVLLVPVLSGAKEAQPQFDQQVRATVGGAVSVLLGDNAGNLWIGTRHEGLWRLTPSGLSQWSSQNGLPDDTIRSLFIDDEQDLWIGMLTGGLSRWRRGALAPYGDPEGFHATYAANVLADSRGDLWLGTWGKGLFRRHKGELIPYQSAGHADLHAHTCPCRRPQRANMDWHLV
jgi:ligand-binding sensor domain-containing protein